MANILLDAANWSGAGQGFPQSPPPWWTGSTYDYIGNQVDGLYYAGAIMTYAGTVNAGDTVAGSIHSTSADNTEFSITVNGTPVATETLTTGHTYAFSFTLAASDVVVVNLGVGDHLYSQDAVLTPAAPPPVPQAGFVFAPGDSLSPGTGQGFLTTLLEPPTVGAVNVSASYTRTPRGLAAVFYGASSPYTLPLPEDIGPEDFAGMPRQQYTWKSKKFVFPGQTTFAAAKVVHSCAGGGVRFRLYIDCCCVYETVVRGCVPFRLPPQLRGITCEIELIGCSRVTEVRVASSIRELMGDE